MSIINATHASRIVQDVMSGVVKQIIAEEADAAASRVRERVVAEGMAMRFSISGLASRGMGALDELTVKIDIHEAKAHDGT